MMESTRIEGILLDFDGTLVDSEPLYYQANNAAFQEYGHRIDEQLYYKHWTVLGEGAEGEIRRNQLDHIDLHIIQNRAKQIFSELSQTRRIPLLPGAGEFLAQLRESRYRTVIASNSPETYIRKILMSHGIPMDRLPVVGCRSGRRRKPYPDIFLDSLELLQLNPDDCLVVEDTVKGLQAARKAGIPCAVIRSSRYPTTQFPGAARIFSDLESLGRFLFPHRGISD